MEHSCKVCGIEYKVDMHKLKTRGKVGGFCSRGCFRKWITDRSSKKNGLGTYDGMAVYLDPDGYAKVNVKGKPKFVHVLVAEKALGKSLPIGVIVHHINGNRSDYSNNNLVILQNHKEHMMMHSKIRSKTSSQTK